MNKLERNFPRIPKGMRILVIGASGGIGSTLVKALIEQEDMWVGAHYASQKRNLEKLSKNQIRLKLFKKKFQSEKDCIEVVKKFYKWSRRLDALVVCSGAISNPVHWSKLKSKDWEQDLFINLSVPFYISRTAMKYMNKNGRIVFFGTESSLHGGNPASLAYGVAKMGVECLVKGLAREGAKKGILVNMIRPGFIASGFHQRWQKKSKKDLKKRENMVLIKRAGTPQEVAALIAYLLSDWGGFITGQSLAITGGDWL